MQKIILECNLEDLKHVCWEEWVKSGKLARRMGSEQKTGKEDCKYTQVTLQLGMREVWEQQCRKAHKLYLMLFKLCVWQVVHLRIDHIRVC